MFEISLYPKKFVNIIHYKQNIELKINYSI
jgi:hypothetical protein